MRCTTVLKGFLSQIQKLLPAGVSNLWYACQRWHAAASGVPAADPGQPAAGLDRRNLGWQQAERGRQTEPQTQPAASLGFCLLPALRVWHAKP